MRKQCPDHVAFLHWSGHGFLGDAPGESPDDAGVILWQGKGTNQTPVPFALRELRKEFEIEHANEYCRIEFAFLSFCEGSAAANKVATDRAFYPSLIEGVLRLPIEVLIAPRWEVDECLARHFAKRLYRYLIGQGKTIHIAFHEARKDIRPYGTQDLHRECRRYPREVWEQAAGLDEHLRETTWLSPVLVLRDYPWSGNPLWNYP